MPTLTFRLLQPLGLLQRDRASGLRRLSLSLSSLWYAASHAQPSAATAECLQMHGGIGMTDEFDIGLFLKRARVDSVLFGDAAFHADRVATMLGY